MSSIQCTSRAVSPIGYWPLSSRDRRDPKWRNIYPHVAGLLVCVMRSKEKRHALVLASEHGDNAFIVAQAVRDALLSTMGPSIERAPRARFQKKANSNTGYVGISESVKWIRGGRRINGFAISLPGGKPSFKRIYYGGHRSREQALKLAVKLRADWDAKRAKGGVL